MSKLGDFQHSLHQHKPDIAIVTETKVTPEKASQTDLTFPGYCPPVRRDRTAHGGGVAIWVKTGISFKELDITHNINTNNHNNHEHPSLNDQEIVWISVELQGGQRVGVCGAYRPGTFSDTDTALLDAIDAGIDHAKITCSRVIVAGDFNVHNTAWLGSSRTTVAGEAAEDLCY